VDDDTSGGILQVEWNQIACGAFHTVAVTPKGDLFTWGDGSIGQLGHGDTVILKQPKLVTSCFIGKEVVHVACGSWHTVVVTGEGELYTWYVYQI
jgi:alpha-tubulin suppressor-like RCC1 family protein